MSDENQDKPIPEEDKKIPVPEERQDKPILKSEQMTVKRSTFKTLIVGIVIALIAVSFLGGYTLGQNTSKNISYGNIIPEQTGQTNPQPSSQTNPPAPKVFVSYKDSPMKGNQDAPVTMIEFSDFQCPFCGRFFADTLPGLEQNYIDSGKVKFVFRDYPIANIHHNAISAALSAQCANEQNKFWQYHDALFSTQSQWEGLDAGNVTKTFKQYAVNLGLNSDNFNSCLDSSKYLGVVQRNFQDGSSYNVSGTPTFFIGNDKDGYVEIVGAEPYSIFQQAIDAQLH